MTVDTATSRLVEQQFAQADALKRAAARPAHHCPTHQMPLDEGPVHYRCPVGHGVMAADLDHEYQPPTQREVP